MELREGATFGERYRLERCLGEGGMGVVWSARDEQGDRHVALKFLRHRTEEGATPRPLDARGVRRFVREARAAMAVDHPNVIKIHEIVANETMPYMVMELLRGESLGVRLHREKRLSLRETGRTLVPVISAVGSIHAAGIVHRDLKPDNIFLAEDDRGRLDVRVLDFGIARLTAKDGAAAQTAGLTSTGAMLGTPFYMSPEQVFNEKDIDHRADVWALGVILYECLSGVRPIDGDSLGQIFKAIAAKNIPPIVTHVPDLPNDVAAMIGKMLTFDRDARMRDLREVHELLLHHTKIHSTAFGAPTPTLDFDEGPVQAVVQITPGAHATADTLSSSLSRTAPDTKERPPPRRGPLILGVGAAIVAVSAFFALRSGPTPVAAPAAASSPILAASPSAIAVPIEQAPSASSIASAAPPVASSAPPIAPAKIVQKPVVPTVSAAPAASPVASVAPAAPSEAATNKTGILKKW